MEKCKLEQMRANKKMEMIIVALLNNAKKPQVKDAQ